MHELTIKADDDGIVIGACSCGEPFISPEFSRKLFLGLYFISNAWAKHYAHQSTLLSAATCSHMGRMVSVNTGANIGPATYKGIYASCPDCDADLTAWWG